MGFIHAILSTDNWAMFKKNVVTDVMPLLIPSIATSSNLNTSAAIDAIGYT